MDRLDSMSIFLAAVDAGSLSAASRRLRVPLATVSRKVSELETHLKTRLLNRSSRRLTLTDAGQSYVVACRRILEEIGEAERAASGEYAAPKGDLAIAAPFVFGRLHVLPVVMAFLKAYPEIDIRMMLSDRVVDLLDEHVDAAVRIGALPDSSLVALKVGTIRRVVCASPAYLRAHDKPKTPADLENHACISFGPAAAADGWAFKGSKAEITVPVHSRLVVNTAEAAIDAAVAGVGVTRVLSYQAAQAVRKGKLVILLRDYEPAPAPVHLLHRGEGMLPLKLRAFLDFAAPRLKNGMQQAAID